MWPVLGANDFVHIPKKSTSISKNRECRNTVTTTTRYLPGNRALYFGCYHHRNHPPCSAICSPPAANLSSPLSPKPQQPHGMIITPMTTRPALLEAHANELFYLLEENLIVLAPGFSSRPFKRFLQRVQDTRFAYVSDADTLEGHHDDWKALTNTRDNVTLTYDSAIHCLANGGLAGANFVLLDGVDDRSINSDIFLSFLGEVKDLKTKLIIALRSQYKLHLYKDYLEKQGHTVGVLDVVESNSVDVLFLPSTPTESKLYTEVVTTLSEIFNVDTITDSYDVLIIVSSRTEVTVLTQTIANSFAQRDFGIITHTNDYTTRGAHRRVIITEATQSFLDINHRIKYIIDSGLVEVTKSDTNGFDYLQRCTTNHNSINQHASILHMEGSKYFCMTSASIKEFEYGVNNSNLIHHMLYACKFSTKLHKLKFLKAPRADAVLTTLDSMIYLSQVTIIDEEDYEFTPLAHQLSKFDIPSSMPLLSLYIALLRTTHTKDILRLVALIEVLGTHALSSYIKDLSFDTRLVVATSDLLTLINVVNHSIFDEPIDPKTRKVSKNPFSKDIQRRVKKRCLQLSLLIQEKGQGNATDEIIEEALILGGQTLFGTVIKTADAETGKLTVTVKPLNSFQGTSMTMILRRNAKEASVFQDGDLVLIHGYSLLYDGKRQMAFVDLVSKVKKQMALKLSNLLKTS